MLAFSRITSILLFVLSLSFLTCAAPTPKSNALAVREGVRTEADLLVAACVDKRAKIVAHADAIVKIDDSVKNKAVVDVVVKELKAYADLVLKVKVDAGVDVKVKAEIAAHILVILKASSAVVKICAHLIAKLSLSVALDLIATLQVALKLVIDNLNVCIAGFLEVFVKLVADADLKAIADVRLDAIVNLCLAVRAKLGLNVNVAGLVGISL